MNFLLNYQENIVMTTGLDQKLIFWNIETNEYSIILVNSKIIQLNFIPLTISMQSSINNYLYITSYGIYQY